MEDSLEQQFQRLSQLEQPVLSGIVRQAEPVTLAQLRTILQLSPSDLCNAMQSLGRRSLLENPSQATNSTAFSLAPVLREYVKSQYPPSEG
ncbi:MAG: hypothetical protein GDA43_15105 [Hormoscilla sp. SP5CHS1]|nr:hypothetical protein [Hormoscilla sp. SP5CHS1]